MADTTPPAPEATPEPTPAPEPVPETTDSAPVTPENPPASPAAQPAVAAPPTAAPAIAPANGLAIAAMVVGIVAVISSWIPLWGLLASAAAIILGALGLKKAGGKGMSITGIVTGGVAALTALFVTVFFVIAIIAGVTAADRSREMSLEREREAQSLVDAKKDFAKGEIAKFGTDFEVRINSVERNYNPGASYTPKAGKEYIVVNVTIKNISDTSEYPRISSFTVLDNGLTERYSLVPVTNELDSSSIAAGGSITGNVVYQVTKDATDLKLQYTVYSANTSYKKFDFTLAF